MKCGASLGDVETLLDQAELDFVDVCTRPYSHTPLTRLAAERGLPSILRISEPSINQGG